LAEGHNDIAMVALALLWLLGLMRGWRAAPIALAASALCKYATAPLFILDAIHAIRYAKAGWRSFTLRLAATTAFALAIMAVFYRSPQFFDGIRVVNQWHFLRPVDAVHAIELTLGLSLLPLRFAVFAVFPVLAVHAVWTAWKVPTCQRLIQAAVALVASIIFAAASHVWPWYAVWTLGLAALVPTWSLSRFIIGVAILAPFTVASWWVEPFAHHREIAALVMYGGAFAWMVFTRPGSVTRETAREAGRSLPSVDARAVDRPAFHIERTGTHG
jgi:alpha-1,6-mannosyltransferase